MTYTFTIKEDSSLMEEVEPGKYEPCLKLTLVSMEEGLEKMTLDVSESLRLFLGENLYVQAITPVEYLLRASMFGKGLTDKQIDKGVAKIKKKWAKTRKEGEYSIVL